jgi:hypothetical protein
VGTVGSKRRTIGGVGIFTGSGAAFIGQRGGWVPSMAGVEGVSMLPD